MKTAEDVAKEVSIAPRWGDALADLGIESYHILEAFDHSSDFSAHEYVIATEGSIFLLTVNDSGDNEVELW